MTDRKHHKPFELSLMTYNIKYEELDLYTVVTNYDWFFANLREST